MDTKDRDEMYKKSGEVELSDPLVAFLYVMLRNGAGPGVIHEALENMTNQPMRYTNGWLAQYAKYVAEKMRGFSLQEYVENKDKPNEA